MKSRIIWGAVLVAAFVAFYYVTIRPSMTPLPPRAGTRVPLVQSPPTFELPPEMTAMTIPAPVLPTPKIPQVRVDPPALQMEIPIQHGATIDFSLGGPVVRSGGADDAALEKALKEMAEATKDVTFPPQK